VSGLKLHFLNVGDGDCTIIDFPARIVRSSQERHGERVMMVDIHHHEDHDDYEHVLDYYKRNFKDSEGNIRPIFRYVSTHPHKDHIKGLDALFNEVSVWNFWDIEHRFQPDKNGQDWEDYKDDWGRYELVRASTNGSPTVLKYTDKNNQMKFWDEDQIEILSPSDELHQFVHVKEDGSRRTAEEIGQALNNLSYVLLIKFNGLKILLTGDVETKGWEYILKNHKDKIKNIDILKAPHHGRESAFHEEAVKWMNPKHIIFSASTECEHIVPEKYKKAAPNAKTYTTGELGTLVFDCGFDGTIITPGTIKRYENRFLSNYR